MSNHLFIMRHGKSDWNSNVADFDRPLNSRGRPDVKKIALALQQLEINIDCLVSSSAKRTTETAEILRDNLELSSDKLFYEADLYLADMFTILKTIDHYIELHGSNLLLVAHNPGLDNIVNYLAKERPVLTDNGKLMTTSAVAVFELEDVIKANSLTLRHLLRPKELP